MRLFTGWFTMRPECALCGMRFERAQGYWVGAIYVNYAVTATAFAYEETTVADGGVVSGTVKFSGPAPKLEPIAVNKNRDVCGERKPSEALVVGAHGGVKGGVVLIEGVTRGKKVKSDVIV